MSPQTKKIFQLISILLASFILNFSVFVYNYNKLATPYLSEPQRVENADFIMTVTTWLFLLAGLIIAGISYAISRKNK